MASFSSIISLIVVLLAAYAYAAPVVSDLPATTVGLEAENVAILARQENSDDSQEKRSNGTIGLSSSESDSKETTQATGKVSERDVEDSSVVPANERDVEDSSVVPTNERDVEVSSVVPTNERDVEVSSVVPTNERDVAEDLFSTEKTERSMHAEPAENVEETPFPSKGKINIAKRNLNQPWLGPQSDEQQAQKRSVEMVETSTDIEQSSVPSTMQVENAKRSLNQPWLAPQSDEQQAQKRSVEMVETSTDIEQSSVPSTVQVENAKRSLNQPWLAPQSDEQQAQKRSVEMGEPSTSVGEPPVPPNEVDQSSGPSTNEIHGSQIPLEQSSPLTNQASEQFNKRAIKLVKQPKQNTQDKRDTDASSVTNEEDQDAASEKRATASVESVVADELSTVISVRIQPEATTDEQPSSSSSTVEYVETSSTSEYDTTVVPVEEYTTVVPVEEYTTVSSIPRDTTSKILAIIPGQISKSEVVVQPVTEKPVVVVRSFENVRLSEATHATILKEKKPNN